MKELRDLKDLTILERGRTSWKRSWASVIERRYFSFIFTIGPQDPTVAL